MSIKTTSTVTLEPSSTDITVTEQRDLTVPGSRDVDVVKPTSIIEGVKKEYSIVGDGLYASVTADETPFWLTSLIDSVVSSSVASGMQDYDSLVQDVRNAIDAIDVAANTYVQQINIDATIDAVVVSAIATQNATLGSVYATKVELATTAVSADSALALSISDLNSSLTDNINSRVTTVETALATETQVRASEISALSTEIVTGNGELAIAISELETSTNTIITDTATNVQNAFTYDSDITIGDFHYSSGFGLNTSVTTSGDGSAGNAFDSEFWINAEKFKFTNSAQSGSVTAFSIDASGATPVIAFNGTVTIGGPVYNAIAEKSRTFSTTPTAPYSVGDLWNISTGVLTATVARSAAEYYTLSDWSLMSTKNVFRGAWVTLTAYSPGDIVTNAGESYSNLVGVASSNTAAPVVGSTWALYAAKGDKGDDGDSYTGTTEYYKLTNSTTAPTIASGSWLTSPQNPTSSNQYLWNFNRNTRTLGSDIDSPVSLVTQYVADGRGISSITELYAKSSSATTSPTVWGTYSSSLPLSDAEPYLWNKTTTSYTVGASTSTSTVIAVKGADGDSYTGTAEHYQLTSSSTAPVRYNTGTTNITSSWSTSPSLPTSTNTHLWNFNRNTRTIGAAIDSSVTLVTQYVEDGNGISSIAEQYAKSSSTTTAPTGWGTYANAVPLTVASPYLWNKTTTTYTDTSETSTSTIIAVRGTNADALTVTSSTSGGATTLTFSDGTTAIVNDGTSPAASGITIIYASNAAGTTTSFTQGTHRYANYYEWTGTAPTTIPSGLVYTLFIGEDGDNAGVIPIYADDAAGTNRTFTNNNKDYVNFYEWTGAAPTTPPTGLTYVKFIGDPGADGVSYTGTAEYYKLTNTSTAPSRYSSGTVIATGWSTTPSYPTSANNYLWNFNRSSKSDSTSYDSAVSLVTQYVVDGAAGRGISNIAEKYQTGTSASTAPTGTWYTTLAGAGSVSVSNPYLWNQTTITYSDASAATVVETVIAVKGDTGADSTVPGPPGSDSTVPGPTGTAGAGFFRYEVALTSWPSTANASTYFYNASGRPVVQDDVLTIFSATAGKITETRRYTGSAWVTAALLLHGDMIATGTITASNLATGTLSADVAEINTIIASHLIVNDIVADSIVSNTTITAPTINGGSIVAGLIHGGLIRGSIFVEGAAAIATDAGSAYLCWLNGVADSRSYNIANVSSNSYLRIRTYNNTSNSTPTPDPVTGDVLTDHTTNAFRYRHASIQPTIGGSFKFSEVFQANSSHNSTYYPYRFNIQVRRDSTSGPIIASAALIPSFGRTAGNDVTTITNNGVVFKITIPVSVWTVGIDAYSSHAMYGTSANTNIVWTATIPTGITYAGGSTTRMYVTCNVHTMTSALSNGSSTSSVSRVPDQNYVNLADVADNA